MSHRGITYGCIFLSAFLYAIPVFWNTYVWWSAFFFLLPFFYLVRYAHISYQQAYLWGWAAALFHLGGIFVGLVRLADGLSWHVAIPILGILFYTALFGFIVAAVPRIIQLFFNLCSTERMIGAYGCAFFVYVTVMDHLSLTPFDCREGYFLMHPILSFSAAPRLLRLLPVFKTEGLCVLLISTQSALFLFLVHRSFKRACFLGIHLFFWLYCLMSPLPLMQRPSWLSRVVVLPYVFDAGKKNPEIMAQEAALFFQNVLKKYPFVDLLLMPEGAFYCDTLESSAVHSYFGSTHVTRAIHLLAGGFTWEQDAYRNTLYWFYDGQLQERFHKKHAMVLTERIPSWVRCKLLHDLYFKNFHEIVPSCNERIPLRLNEEITIVPYICSELFFAKKPRDAFSEYPVYAMCNDRWAPAHIRLLMLRVAQYKAIEWQRAILYVSFGYQRYIDQHGTMIRLTTYRQ